MTIHHTWLSVSQMGLDHEMPPEIDDYVVVHSFPDTVRGRLNAHRSEQDFRGEFGFEGAVRITQHLTNGGYEDLVHHVAVFPDELVYVMANLQHSTLNNAGWLEMDDFTHQMRPLLDRHWRSLSMDDRLDLVRSANLPLQTAMEDPCPPELWRELQDQVDP